MTAAGDVAARHNLEQFIVRGIPFAEIGVSTSTWDGDAELLYAVGLKARGRYGAGRATLTLGGAAKFANPRSARGRIEDYTMLSLGVDAQLPLGSGAGGRTTRAGLYVIGRTFPDLDLGPVAVAAQGSRPDYLPVRTITDGRAIPLGSVVANDRSARGRR